MGFEGCRSASATKKDAAVGEKVEARLNALPTFMTEIDGVDIHFIHVRSKHENALPLIVTHGAGHAIMDHDPDLLNRRGCFSAV